MQRVVFVLVIITLLVGCGGSETLSEAVREAPAAEIYTPSTTATLEPGTWPAPTEVVTSTRPDWVTVTPRATATLAASDPATSPPEVYFVPVGDVRQATMDTLAEHYQWIRVLSPLSIPSDLRDTTRNQLAAEDVLMMITHGYPDHASDPNVILIGITSGDLFSRHQPDVPYVLQQAQDLRTAVISDARIYDGVSPNRAEIRLRKVISRLATGLYAQLIPTFVIDVTYSDINTIEDLDALPVVNVVSALLTPDDLPVESAHVSVWASIGAVCHQLDGVQAIESADTVFTPLELDQKNPFFLLPNWVWTTATEEEAQQAMALLRQAPNCPLLVQDFIDDEGGAQLPATSLELVPLGDQSIAVHQVLPQIDGADLQVVVVHLRIGRVLAGFLMTTEDNIDPALIEDMARRLDERVRILIEESTTS